MAGASAHGSLHDRHNVPRGHFGDRRPGTFGELFDAAKRGKGNRVDMRPLTREEHVANANRFMRSILLFMLLLSIPILWAYVKNIQEVFFGRPAPSWVPNLAETTQALGVLVFTGFATFAATWQMFRERIHEAPPLHDEEDPNL